ncbi:winged helix-turn-helix domain-containing protein [Novosphingobium terrae]|uniref:winged helix-turn-helix domain-containing protein n=1 Tax=Novosphingobium terrae TaxID=2726189 RepID=UPI00197F00B0|nr:winged helix-turn-helix domain-containing protein [Novosphingobium terrae]
MPQGPEFTFGDFTLDLERKMLWQGHAHVPVGHRAFAILALLVENPGRLVTKSELFERAWPGISVDAANLRVQIGNIRRLLGPSGKDIVTEQSLGYSFQGDVRLAPLSRPAQITERFYAPANLTSPIGRERDISALEQGLASHRLVSIVGPGGIGKTTLALEVARRVDPDFLDGICFVDLGAAVEEGDVLAAVAAALQRPVQSHCQADILACLRTRRVLMVLDCCERMIEPVAHLAEAILANAPGVSVLATSREALRLPGEFVLHADGLAVPESDCPLDQAMGFGGFALFMRAAASAGAGPLAGLLADRGDVALIADICRRLDGIPLAIELAASLSGTLALQQIRQSLDERISGLAPARRGGPARHRTLDATITWSYDMLGEIEALALRRLSIFAGDFSLTAAQKVIAYGEIDNATATRAIAALAQKSLLSSRILSGGAQYRLLETTRYFAEGRLTDLEERSDLSRRHARYVLETLRAWEPNILSVLREDNAPAAFARDVHAALERIFADSQASLLGIELTLAAESLWLALGLYDEHARWMRRAEEALGAAPQDGPLAASVLTGRAYSVLYNTADDRLIELVGAAVQSASQIGDDILEMRNLFHGVYFNLIRHRGGEALRFARAYHDRAKMSGNHALLGFASVAVAIAQVQTGDWEQAMACFEATLASPPPALPDPISIRLGLDVGSLALFELGGLIWIQGHARRGTALIEEALRLTEQNGSPQNRFQVLCFGGCSSAILCGDRERLRHYLALLEAHAREFALWAITASAYRGGLAYLEGRYADARDLLEQYFAASVPSASLDGIFLTILAEVRGRLGDEEGALAALADAWARRTSDRDPFIAAQVHRVRGTLALGKPQEEDMAAALYRQSIAVARANRTLAFEIPAVMDLARLECSHGRYDEALTVLRSTLASAPADEDLPGMSDIRRLAEEIEFKIR